MRDDFRARFETGDNDPLRAFIVTRFRYANRRTDPQVIDMYVDNLRSIPLERLEKVWGDAQPKDRPVATVPSIEYLRQAYATRLKDFEERVSDAKKKAVPAPGEREIARRAVATLYANRCNNRGGMSFAVAEPPYYGDFDYKAVANAAPLPDLHQHDHRSHWAELWRIFDEEWAGGV